MNFQYSKSNLGGGPACQAFALVDKMNTWEGFAGRVTLVTNVVMLDGDCAPWTAHPNEYGPREEWCISNPSHSAIVLLQPCVPR